MDDDENIGLFDLDGSLADYNGQLLEDLERLRSPNEEPITDLYAAEEIPHIKERMDLIKRKPGWWANLPLIKKGWKVLEAARDLNFDCRVLTKGPRTNAQAWKEKLDWSFANLGQLAVTITLDKASVYGKFLYDDYPEYCYRWLNHRPRGLVIMPVERFTKEHEHPQILQWDGTNFDQVKRTLTACYKRQPHEEMVIPR